MYYICKVTLESYVTKWFQESGPTAADVSTLPMLVTQKLTAKSANSLLALVSREDTDETELK